MKTVPREYRGKIAAALAFFGAVWFALSLMGDLGLAPVERPLNAPDLVVEDFSFSRTIDGRVWNVSALTAEHRAGTITASELSIDIAESDDRTASFTAMGGEFDTEGTEFLLKSVAGVIHAGKDGGRVTAPVASCDTATGAWLFSNGVEFTNDEAVFEGGVASSDAAGLFYFGNGVRVRWTGER